MTTTPIAAGPNDVTVRAALDAGIAVTHGLAALVAEVPTWNDLQSFADLIAAAERERICAAIKAEDDYCADGDYMLDSDDCISVARGTWKRPDWNVSNAEGQQEAACGRSAAPECYTAGTPKEDR